MAMLFVTVDERYVDEVCWKMKLGNNCFQRSTREVALVITTAGPDSVTRSYLENVFHTLCICPFSSSTTAVQELNDSSYVVSWMVKALYSTLLLFILKMWHHKLAPSPCWHFQWKTYILRIFICRYCIMIFHRIIYHVSAISYRRLLYKECGVRRQKFQLNIFQRI